MCAEFRYIFNEKDIENKNVSRCHWKGKKGYGIIKCVIGFCQEYVPKFGTHKRKKDSEKSRLEHWNSEK